MSSSRAVSPPTAHGLRREAIVESLLADVFEGRIRAGQHLVTQDLAERFRVSHTPIREALIALAGIGIIRLEPNRGAIVRQVSPSEVREVCQVRRALECEAVRSACRRIEPGELHDLAAAFQALMAMNAHSGAAQVVQARTLDSRLHDLVAEASGNQFLKQELNRLKLLFRAFRDVAWRHDSAHQNYRRLSEEAREHLAIVVALQAGDAREAAKAMSRHIRSGMVSWTRAMTASDELVSVGNQKSA